MRRWIISSTDCETSASQEGKVTTESLSSVATHDGVSAVAMAAIVAAGSDPLVSLFTTPLPPSISTAAPPLLSLRCFSDTRGGRPHAEANSLRSWRRLQTLMLLSLPTLPCWSPSCPLFLLQTEGNTDPCVDLGTYFTRGSGSWAVSSWFCSCTPLLGLGLELGLGFCSCTPRRPQKSRKLFCGHSKRACTAFVRRCESREKRSRGQ